MTTCTDLLFERGSPLPSEVDAAIEAAERRLSSRLDQQVGKARARAKREGGERAVYWVAGEVFWRECAPCFTL